MNGIIIFGAKYLVFILLLVAGIFFLRLVREKQKRILILGAVSLPLTFALARLASLLYFNPRPFVVGKFTPLIAHAADNGFPSDHTLLASAVAATVFAFNRKWGIALWLGTFLVGLARVLAGVHHALDIAGSMLIAAAVCCAAQKFLAKSKFFNRV